MALVKGVCEAKGVAAIIKDMIGEDQGAIGIYTEGLRSPVHSPL